jgi:hypothetical protein
MRTESTQTSCPLNVHALIYKRLALRSDPYSLSQGWGLAEEESGCPRLRERDKHFDKYFGLAINEPAIVYSSQVCLRMNSLRRTAPDNCGLGSTNRPSQNRRRRSHHSHYEQPEMSSMS